MLLNEIVSYWVAAGEQPYEVLIEENIYETFLELLKTKKYQIYDKLYRGLYNTYDVHMDNIHPTSWTTHYETALNFVNHSNGTILCLTSQSAICATEVKNDYYDEKEVIIFPIRLKTVSITYDGNIKIMNVMPDF